MAAQKAPTSYIGTANGVTYAYRHINPSNSLSTPLLMHIHFRANMDHWDPLLVNRLSAARPVIIFDQSGVGRSTGSVSRTYQGWADSLLSFVDALDLRLFHLLGFSMGGRCAQMVALTQPHRVRSLILMGTDCSAPQDGAHRAAWPIDAVKRLSYAGPGEAAAKDAIAFSFFPLDDLGQQAAREYWSRIRQRDVTGEQKNLGLLERDAGAKHQMAASRAWHEIEGPSLSWHRLHELRMPVLVLLGEIDALVPTPWGRELAERIVGPSLKIYQGTGHGFIWQCADEVANDIDVFVTTTKNAKL